MALSPFSHIQIFRRKMQIFGYNYRIATIFATRHYFCSLHAAFLNFLNRYGQTVKTLTLRKPYLATPVYNIVHLLLSEKKKCKIL